jgi:hypothetical protein
MNLCQVSRRNGPYRNRRQWKNRRVDRHILVVLVTRFIEHFPARTIKTIAGQVPIDNECVTMLDKAHVYCENTDTFDCMLNQVRITMKLSTMNLIDVWSY